MCVGCCFSENLTKSQRSEGLDRSYRGIKLNLLASVCELKLALDTKQKWFLPTESQFHWWWLWSLLKKFNDKIASGHKVHIFLRFISMFSFPFCCIPRPCALHTLHCSTSRWIIEEESKLWSGKGVYMCKHISLCWPLVSALNLTGYLVVLLRLSASFPGTQPSSQVVCACVSAVEQIFLCVNCVVWFIVI